jgi:phage shock protein A
MGFLEHVNRVVRTNLEDFSQSQNPELVMQQALLEIQTALEQSRQASINLIACQKRTQQQLDQAIAEAAKWQTYEQKALQKEDTQLAQEAALRKKNHTNLAKQLQAQLELQASQVQKYRHNTIALEQQLLEFQARKEELRTRMQRVTQTMTCNSSDHQQILPEIERLEEKLRLISVLTHEVCGELAALKKRIGQTQQTSMSHIGSSSAMAAFERMESALSPEMRAQEAVNLAGADLEARFAAIENEEVDPELEAMKKQMLSNDSALIQINYPEHEDSQSKTSSGLLIDEELKRLKEELDNL